MLLRREVRLPCVKYVLRCVTKSPTESAVADGRLPNDENMQRDPYRGVTVVGGQSSVVRCGSRVFYFTEGR